MIYDCFTFYNELDLLEIRLNILNDVVDKFVLVEMDKTHAGKDKPFVFEENKSRYEKFLDKIIHIKITDYPDIESSETDAMNQKWILENYQRDCIMQGLSDAKEDDTVIISDIDEIPNPDKIKEYLTSNKKGIQVFVQNFYYYYLNNQHFISKEREWYGSKIGSLKDLSDPQCKTINRSSAMFSKRGLPTFFRCNCIGSPIKNGGWHFSYLGNIDFIYNKMQCIVEGKRNLSKQDIENSLKSNKDVIGRNIIFRKKKIDKTFPKYIQENQDKYKHLIINVGFPDEIQFIRTVFPYYFKKIIKNIFSVTNQLSKSNEKHKVLTVMGIKIKFKSKK